MIYRFIPLSDSLCLRRRRPMLKTSAAHLTVGPEQPGPYSPTRFSLLSLNFYNCKPRPGIIGWEWIPTMAIGSGCKIHLQDGDLPRGRLIVTVSKHMVAVVDGVIHDTTDPSRDGTRCVYGYWRKT